MRLETCRVGVAELYSAGRDYAVPVWICDQFATAVVTTLYVEVYREEASEESVIANSSRRGVSSFVQPGALSPSVSWSAAACLDRKTPDSR